MAIILLTSIVTPPVVILTSIDVIILGGATIGVEHRVYTKLRPGRDSEKKKW